MNYLISRSWDRAFLGKYMFVTNKMQLIYWCLLLTTLYMFWAFFAHHQELMNRISSLW